MKTLKGQMKEIILNSRLGDSAGNLTGLGIRPARYRNFNGDPDRQQRVVHRTSPASAIKWPE
jgi:hypothetical protein